jgi:invasion protein IalB
MWILQQARPVHTRLLMKVARHFTVALLMTIAGGASAQQVQQRPPVPRPAPPPQAAPAPQPSAPPASAAKDDAPQRTTATYDDWVVQCQTAAGPPPEKQCEMAQVAQLQGKNIPFSRVGIAHPVKGQPVRLVAQVPVNVSFANSARIQIGDTDPGVAAPFARCLPGGCFVEFEIKDDLLKKFRAAPAGGKLTFADGGGHDITVPLSFNGFAVAFDALSKE